MREHHPVDRRAINIMLATLDVEQRDLAQQMGYEPSYVSNVLNGFTAASPAFRRAFGDTIASVLLGELPQRDRYPAAPLREIVERRARQAPSKRDFYGDLGLSTTTLRQEWLSGRVVDRVCCALGIHLDHIYPDHSELSEVS